jgi:hypothetical protein
MCLKLMVSLTLAFGLLTYQPRAQASAEACAALVNESPAPQFSSELSRDLSVDDFVKNVAQKYELSEHAAELFKASLVSGMEPTAKLASRQQMIKRFLTNPEAMSAAKKLVDTVSASKSLQSTIVNRGSKVGREVLQVTGEHADLLKKKASEYQDLYVLASPVISFVSGFGGPVTALAVTAVHSRIPGTSESLLVAKYSGAAKLFGGVMMKKGGTLAEGFLSAAKSKVGGIVGDDNVEKMLDTGRCMASGCVTIAGKAGVVGNQLKDQMLEVATVYSAEAGTKLSDMIVEFEVSYVYARMAQDWQAQGLPVNQPEFVEADAPYFEMTTAHSPTLAAMNLPSTPLTLTMGGSASSRGENIVLSGKAATGKSSLLSSIAYLTMIAQAGGYVPAASLRMTPLQIRTSMTAHGTVDAQKNEIAGIMNELDEQAVTNSVKFTLVLLDGPFNGSPEAQRNASLSYVLDKFVGYPVLSMIATPLPATAKALSSKPATRALRMKKAKDGSIKMESGVAAEEAKNSDNLFN